MMSAVPSPSRSIARQTSSLGMAPGLDGMWALSSTCARFGLSAGSITPMPLLPLLSLGAPRTWRVFTVHRFGHAATTLVTSTTWTSAITRRSSSTTTVWPARGSSPTHVPVSPRISHSRGGTVDAPPARSIRITRPLGPAAAIADHASDTSHTSHTWMTSPISRHTPSKIAAVLASSHGASSLRGPDRGAGSAPRRDRAAVPGRCGRDDDALGMTLLQYGPMRRAIWVPCCIGLGVCVGAGCSKKSQDGLPPATEWQASLETAPAAPGTASDLPRFNPPPGMGGRKANPHAGMDMSDPSNPHAGLDMSDPSNPHAGLDMGGTDVTKLGLAAPDPDRAIDPSRRVTGKIVVDAKVKDNAMVAGTELSGDVVVTARYDQDTDALTKQPGDITGQVRVTIPADNVKLTLDT